MIICPSSLEIVLCVEIHLFPRVNGIISLAFSSEREQTSISIIFSQAHVYFMNILINKNGHQMGPYTIERARALVLNGTISANDWAWIDGATDWIQLSLIPNFVLQEPSASVPPPPTIPQNRPENLARSKFGCPVCHGLDGHFQNCPTHANPSVTKTPPLELENDSTNAAELKAKKQPRDKSEIETVLAIGLAVGLLYFGGWSVIWRESFWTSRDFFVKDKGFAFRVNDFYYGAKFNDRFFDSPALSWVCLFLALSSISGGGFLLVRSSSGNHSASGFDI